MEILDQLKICIQRGKVNRTANHPADLAGRDGADELTSQALQNGISPDDILQKACMPAMREIGDKFSAGQAFIPDLLIAAKAMNTAMAHLKPHFDSGVLKKKGTFIIGTVTGDMHDIGKNLVRMVLEGAGWNVVDLGTNADEQKFIQALDAHPHAMVGLSALLTTTMLNMQPIVKGIKERYPQTQIFIGGAPLTAAFNKTIGADGYFKDPRGLVHHLEQHPTEGD